MEALVAIGLAGNVVQFVDFSSKLISEANAIRMEGSPSSLSRMRELSSSIIQHAQSIKVRLESNTTALQPEEKWLLDITTKCKKAGLEFESYLNTFDIGPGKATIIRSAKVSAKILLKQNKLHDFVADIQQLQGSLLLATVAALRSSFHCKNADIFQHLEKLQTDAQNRFQLLQIEGEKRLKDLFNEVHFQIKESNDEDETLREEELREIKKQEDAAETLKNLQKLLNTVEGRLDAKVETLHNAVETCLGQVIKARNDAPRGRECEILDWLSFRQRTWRSEEIDPAYQKTYDWIFRSPPGITERKWDNFTTYLSEKETDTAYFINGKAGSGKSTLMKFAAHHPNTLVALKKWAGSGRHQILVLDFYFWNLGTELQRGHVGLLRTLLHGVLSRHPELVPAVLPNIYCNWGPWHRNDEPTYTEMKVALELLLKRSTTFLKLCIFIDGIDEFKGDHRDMSHYLRKLATSTNIKLVVSSRPINACMHAFQGCPSLRLQDLTQSDMDTYVYGRLLSHPRMRRLIQRYPRTDIALDITKKAEGVFLWVKVVVKLLVNGLEAGDRLEDLRQYLHTLPTDLLKLYRKMMDDMKPEYRAQASEIFQIFWRWGELSENKPLNVFRFAHAFEEPLHIFAMPVAAIELDDYQWALEQTEARVRSRCCGLLEVRYRSPRPTRADNPKLTYFADEVDNYETVSYLHRSVAEFLQSGELWNWICSLTQGSKFSRDTSIAYTCLAMLKASHSVGPTDHKVWEELARLVKLSRDESIFDDKSLMQFWITIDQTLSQLQRRRLPRALGGCIQHWSHTVVASSPELYSVECRLRSLGNIETYAALNGFGRLLGLLIARTGLDAHRNTPLSNAIVIRSLESWTIPAVPSKERSDLLLFLLQYVAGPETIAFGKPIWHYALLIAITLSSHEAVELLEIVLCTATSPDTILRGSCQRRDGTQFNFKDFFMASLQGTATQKFGDGSTYIASKTSDTLKSGAVHS